jgi:hypothetical protein
MIRREFGHHEGDRIVRDGSAAAFGSPVRDGHRVWWDQASGTDRAKVTHLLDEIMQGTDDLFRAWDEALAAFQMEAVLAAMVDQAVDWQSLLLGNWDDGRP